MGMWMMTTKTNIIADEDNANDAVDTFSKKEVEDALLQPSQKVGRVVVVI